MQKLENKTTKNPLKNGQKTTPKAIENTREHNVEIRPDLYEELELFAKKFDLSVEQLVDQFLEKEVTESAKKELFSPGLKWFVSKRALIMARIRKEDLPRLNDWLEMRSTLDIVPSGEEGQITIANRYELYHGYSQESKTISVPEQLYKKLENLGKSENKSVSEEAEFLITNATKKSKNAEHTASALCPSGCGTPLVKQKFADALNLDKAMSQEDLAEDLYCPKCDIRWIAEQKPNKVSPSPEATIAMDSQKVKFRR